MLKKEHKVFSLDIGTSSIGWSVIDIKGDVYEIEYDKNTGIVESDFDINKNIDIIASGVRLFNEPVVPNKNSKLLNLGRRTSRITRRRIRRKADRLIKIKQHLCGIKWFNEEDFNFDSPNSVFQRFILSNPNNHNIFKLRVKALDEKLTKDEIAIVLYHVAKYRGFKSSKLQSNIIKDEAKKTKKDDDKSKENDEGKILKAIEDNKKNIDALKTEGINIRTQVEFLVYQVENNKISSYHNKAGHYANCLIRENGEYSVLEEIKLIFAKQRQFYNELSVDFEKTYIDYVLYQRKVIFNANTIGKCSLEKEEFRATKGSYSAEKFVALGKLINLRILTTTEEIQLDSNTIAGFLKESQSTKATTYKALQKYLKKHLDMGDFEFKGLKKAENNKELEKAIIFKFEGFNNLKNALGNYYDNCKDNIELLDNIAQCFAMYKDADQVAEKLKELKLPDDVINNLIQSGLDFKHFINFSFKALYKLMPIMEKVEMEIKQDNKTIKKRYDTTTAIQEAGYSLITANYQNKEILKYSKGGYEEKVSLLPSLSDVIKLNDFYIPNNPAVIRALTQIIKTFNAMIIKYGKPTKVHIELLRELKYGHNTEKHTKTRDANEESRSNARQICQELGINDDEDNILKVRLYTEQSHCCPYCQQSIQPSDFKNRNVEKDHIIPYSVCFSNAYTNLVLVHSDCNQNKGQRTPYLYFKDTEKWNKLENWVLNTKSLSKAKSINLLNTKSIDELRQGFTDRQINDTAYITTIVKNYIEYYYKFDTKHKKNVFATKGALTSILRDIFDFKKYRDIESVNDDKKHFLYASIMWNKEYTSQEHREKLKNLKKENSKQYLKLKDSISTYLLGYINESSGYNDNSEEDSVDNEENIDTHEDNTKNNQKRKKTLKIPDDAKKYIDEVKDYLPIFANQKLYLDKFNEIEKNFIGDKHHAIDAILIGLCNASFVKMVGTLANKADEAISGKIKEAQKDNNQEKLKELLRLKYGNNINNKIRYLLKDTNFMAKLGILDINDFKKKIEISIDKIFVSKAVSRRLMGRLHEDTIYSAKKVNMENKEVLTQRKKLEAITLKDIPKIIGSDKLRETLKNWLEDSNKDKQPPTMPTKDGSIGNIIRNITIATADSGKDYFEVRKGLVNPDKKIRIDIFKHKEINKEGEETYKFAFRPINLADVVINKKIPLTLRFGNNNLELKHEEGDEDNEFLFSLYPGDLFYLQKTKEDKPQYVYYTGYQNGRIEYRDDSNTEKKAKNQRLVKQISAIEDIQKAQVGILGEQYLVKNNRYEPIIFNGKSKKSVFKFNNVE